METRVNNYIVRIYRLNRKNSGNLVGLVEEIGVKEKKPFTSLHELWDILSHPKRTPVTKKKKGSYGSAESP